MPTSRADVQKASVPCRRFNLGDAMILTAAAAVALMPPWDGYLRAVPTMFASWGQLLGHIMGWRIVPTLTGRANVAGLVHSVLTFGAGFLGFPLAGLTLAALWFRLRRPRPSWRDLIRQPGFAASVAAPLGFVAFLESRWFGAEWDLMMVVAGMIGAAWVLLVALRQWRAELGWIDRLGRGVGVVWIVAATFEALGRWI